MTAKVASELWVQALIRRASIAGASAAVVRKGDPTGGAVLVKVFDTRTRSARLYAEALRGGEGERVWMQPRPEAAESDLDAYAERQARFDPDIWVVEIEDPAGRHFLTEPVEGEAAGNG